MSENQIEVINQREIELLEQNYTVNLEKLFTPLGMDLLIVQIKNEVADFKADVTTKEGRAAIKSMAAKVARCKAPIKELATELKDDSKKLIDRVNAQWNHYEAAMDELRDNIRKPVDEIEEKEAAELKARQDRLTEIESYKMRASLPARTSKFLELSIRELKELAKFEWNDFAFKAENLVNEVAEILNQELVSIKKQEADAAELAQLKKEKAEREQKDREDQIAKDDAEKAAADAVEKERLRVAEQKRKDDEAAEKIARNKRHRTKINNEALEMIQGCINGMFGEDAAKLAEESGKSIDYHVAKIIVQLIAEGKIPHVQINY